MASDLTLLAYSTLCGCDCLGSADPAQEVFWRLKFPGLLALLAGRQQAAAAQQRKQNQPTGHQKSQNKGKSIFLYRYMWFLLV